VGKEFAQEWLNAPKVLRRPSWQESKPQEPEEELENDSARSCQEEAKQEVVEIPIRAVQVEE